MRLINLGYDNDIRLEMKFARQIKGILGMYFIRQDVEADTMEATDFLIFHIKPIKVAARLRTFAYLERYPDEFTIRYSRPSGVPTEIHKIRQGLVDYLFYGFVNDTEDKIIKYFIGDLGIFRNQEPKPIVIKRNIDRSSELAAYSLKSLPKLFILKQYYYTTA